MPKLDIGDLLVTAGILCTVGGVAMIHIPTAVILFGLILTAIGYIHSLPQKR